MAEFPKRFVKGDSERIAHNVRDEVKLQFAGYRLATMPKVEEAPAEKSIEDREGTKAPELTEAEMAKVPGVKDAEVVDLTETVKPSAPKRGN
jgi:hypothetical protein